MSCTRSSVECVGVTQKSVSINCKCRRGRKLEISSPKPSANVTEQSYAFHPTEEDYVTEFDDPTVWSHMTSTTSPATTAKPQLNASARKGIIFLCVSVGCGVLSVIFVMAIIIRRRRRQGQIRRYRRLITRTQNSTSAAFLTSNSSVVLALSTLAANSVPTSTLTTATTTLTTTTAVVHATPGTNNR